MLGGQFYDEYNVTSNVSGLVVDPMGAVKVAATEFTAAVNYSNGFIEVTERVPPKWSVILRPPTDKICKDAIRDAAHPFVTGGICPINPRRDAIAWKDRRSHEP